MKFFSFFLGLILLSAIVYAGSYTVNHPTFVVWFGVITAILAPLAFEFLFLFFKSKDNQLIKELSKVPQIERLIKEAKDNELKVQLLEQQRQELDKLISYESKRRSLLAEQQIFILQGKAALEGLKTVNTGLEELTNEKQALPDFLQPLILKMEQGESNDVHFIFGGKDYYLKRSLIYSIPIYGIIFSELDKFLITLITRIKDKKNS